MTIDQSYESFSIQTNSFITMDKIQNAKEFIGLSRLVLQDRAANLFYPSDGLGARIDHRSEPLVLESVARTTNNGFYDDKYTRIGLLYSDLTMYYEIEDDKIKYIDTTRDAYLQFILEAFRTHYGQHPSETFKV